MAFTVLESKLYAGMFGDEETAAVFSDAAVVSRWCRIEIALAEAQAALGIIPDEAARRIAERVRPEAVDLDRLRQGTERVGYPILPLVEILDEMVGPEAGGHLHWGATTQDIMDTALALQMVDVHRIAGRELRSLRRLLAQAARRYRDIPMAGRTHGQQAVPTTLGYKLAVWLSEVDRHLRRWEDLGSRIGFGQLSGAVGNLASLGSAGLPVRDEMCRRLGLKPPTIAWHTARDSLAETGSIFGLIAGTLGKMAQEVANLQRNEIAELSEGFQPGRGSSSTMPQKRNPITSEVMVAQAAYVRQQVPLLTYAMTGLHERAMGEWQVEWIVFPEIAVMSVGLLKNAVSLVGSLVVHEEAMRRNLGLTRGLIVAERVMMALAPHVGRQAAHHLVYAASAKTIENGVELADALLAEPEIARHLSREQLRQLLEPTHYTGNAAAFVDAVLDELGPICEEADGVG